ncbi:MAG TPA: hypothetical protein VIM94_11455 [Salegentibacter sp.]|uniref:hypothetical protein n=1 Tax=Salegentibacter sp. TaxID=1903072 RepID=UPI002F920134
MATALIIILMKLIEATGLPIDNSPETSRPTSENIVMPSKVLPVCHNFVVTPNFKSR